MNLRKDHSCIEHVSLYSQRWAALHVAAPRALVALGCGRLAYGLSSDRAAGSSQSAPRQARKWRDNVCQPSVMDVLARATMKGVVNHENRCDLQNSESKQNLECALLLSGHA